MTGVYIRVKRKGKWENIEFELLTDKEMEEFVAKKQEQKQDGWRWAMCFAQYLRDTVKPLMDGLIEDGKLKEVMDGEDSIHSLFKREIIKYYNDGYSIREIAEMINLPRATVQDIKDRAIRKLKEENRGYALRNLVKNY